jgi:hypothetical protein
MADLLQKRGKIVFLLAEDLAFGYGPPGDQLDVEAVFILHALGEGGYGFQIRNDNNLPARQAMFSLLSDAFTHDLTVIADYLIEPGRKNGIAVRVALIRDTAPGLQEFLARSLTADGAPAPRARAPRQRGGPRRGTKVALPSNVRA